ncbi:MAG: diaminopimelate epimerase [Methanocellales archaeon]|nr:diaminopimelate epimerase [Methanocellales archaeon]
MIIFTKLHGNGNDFILIDEYDQEIIPESKKGAFAERFCARRFGVGADGVLFLSRSKHANLRMRIFNPNGSEAEMCGNGIRCVVKYAIDAGYVRLGRMVVEAIAGDMKVEARKDTSNRTWVKVDMGVPRFEFFEKELEGHKVSAANVGVPHAVIFIDDLAIPIAQIAPKIRHHPIFPEGANVNFVKVGKNILEIRTYERGVEAETLSCGTGAAASAAVANELGKVGDIVNVKTRGGVLHASLKDDHVFIEGTAETAYEGVIRSPF